VRYRRRTALRTRLPYALLFLAPKGRRDCGAHEWYRSDDVSDHCYHCVATRPTEIPPAAP
jgi:predicted dithiol-disulfide oxidoreductase (DUF899 family)